MERPKNQPSEAVTQHLNHEASGMQRLTYAWFQENGYLRDLIVNFSGNMQAAYEYIQAKRARPILPINDSQPTSQITLKPSVPDDHDEPFEEIELVGTYLREIQRIPQLSKNEVVALSMKKDAGHRAQAKLEGGNLTPQETEQLQAIVSQGEVATKQIVAANLRLVVMFAKRRYYSGMQFLDLIQEGNKGLMIAAEKFDWRKGFSFATYASNWIISKIDRAIADQSSTIRLPVHVRDRLSGLNRIIYKMHRELGRKPILGEISDRTGLDIDTVRALLAAQELTTLLELDAPAMAGGEIMLGEFIPAEVDIENDSLSDVDKEKRAKQIQYLLHRFLSPREISIISQRHGIDTTEQSLEIIGRKFGITRERTRQIEAKAYRRLRNTKAFRRVWNESMGKQNSVSGMSISLEGKNPETLILGKFEYIKSNPLLEVLFKLPDVQAKIAYRYLYLSLTVEVISSELKMGINDVLDILNRARIILWEALPMNEGHDILAHRYPLQYFPSLDPKDIEKRYERSCKKLSPNIKKVLQVFFGLNGYRGSFNVAKSAHILNKGKEEVLDQLLHGLLIIG